MVDNYDAERQLFINRDTNFIIHRNEESSVLTAIGKHSASDDKIVPLTPAEREQAQTMGLSIVEDVHVAPIAPVPDT
jgi:hypothetical protein